MKKEAKKKRSYNLSRKQPEGKGGETKHLPGPSSTSKFKAYLLIKIELNRIPSNLGTGSIYDIAGVRSRVQTKLLLDISLRFVSVPQICIRMYLFGLRVNTSWPPLLEWLSRRRFLTANKIDRMTEQFIFFTHQTPRNSLTITPAFKTKLYRFKFRENIDHGMVEGLERKVS